MKIRILLVGLNDKHAEHIESFKNNTDIEIVGSCDKDEATALKISQLFDDCPHYTDPIQAIDASGAEAVFICLPHYLHYPVVKHALVKGLHIFKEKPLAKTFQECMEIAKEVSENHNTLMVVSQRRFHFTYEKAKELLPSIGKPKLVVARYLLNRPASGWRKLNELSGGGVVIDSGYHFIDLMSFFFGSPKSVASKISTTELGDGHDTEDNATVTLDYGDGFFANLMLSREVSEKEESVLMYGEHGTIFVNRTIVKVSYDDERESVVFNADKEWAQAFKKQLEHFVNAIKDHISPITDYKTALMNSSIIDSCYLSGSTGKTIIIE
jgi:UDP-N-acetyl-2-amino-2-deoxyglucuronate dehydrogenase